MIRLFFMPLQRPIICKQTGKIDVARTIKMTKAQKAAQRRSFAYGNAKITDPRVTRKSLREAEKAVTEGFRRYANYGPVVSQDKGGRKPHWLKSIKDRDRTLRFRRPINIKAYRNGDMWFYETTVCGGYVVGYGSTQNEALRVLKLDILSLYREIAEEKPKNLDCVAQMMRLKLLTGITVERLKR